MGLIDVNKIPYLHLDLENKIRFDDVNIAFKDDIDNMPTVDAIPIEWIKNYIIPFQVHHDSLSEETKENDGAGWVVDVLETMLREWEKEND